MTRIKSVLVALALVSGTLLSMGQVKVQRGWQYVATNLLFSPDNTWTIGGSAANRPSTINVGTSVVVAGTTTLSGTSLIFGANANKLVDDGGGIFRMTNSADVGGQLIWTAAGLALKQGTGGGATDTSVFVTNVIRPTGPAITAGAATGLTVNDTGQIRETVYKATVASTAFVSAAVTSDVTIGTLPAKTQLAAVMADLTQTFACASTCTTSTLSMVLGRGAGGA